MQGKENRKENFCYVSLQFSLDRTYGSDTCDCDAVGNIGKYIDLAGLWLNIEHTTRSFKSLLNSFMYREISDSTLEWETWVCLHFDSKPRKYEMQAPIVFHGERKPLQHIAF